MRCRCVTVAPPALATAANPEEKEGARRQQLMERERELSLIPHLAPKKTMLGCVCLLQWRGGGWMGVARPARGSLAMDAWGSVEVV